VSCISCHLAPDGGLLARNDRPEVPCRPLRSSEFLAVDACASCHNQHQTTDQWRASHWQQQGTDCAACHMPRSSACAPTAADASDASTCYEGAHDVTDAEAGVRIHGQQGRRPVDARAEEQRRRSQLPDRRAAPRRRHRGSLRDRRRDRRMAARVALPAAVSPRVDAGQPRNTSGENTQLPADAQKEVRVPIPSDAVAADVRLWYRLTPFVFDDDPRSTLLEERRMVLR
jgi:hypothetical protein